MPSILLQLDKSTYDALGRVAPAAQRKRAEFILAALKAAILKREYALMRAAYQQQPDTESEADDWSTAAPGYALAGMELIESQ